MRKPTVNAAPAAHALERWRKGAPAPIETIVEVVSGHYAVPVHLVMSHRRQHSLIEPRHVAIALALRLTPASSVEVARAFGRDHTTVLYAGRQIAMRAEADPGFAVRMSVLATQCGHAIADCRRRDDRVLAALCHRLETDWAGTIDQLERMIFGEACHAA